MQSQNLFLYLTRGNGSHVWQSLKSLTELGCHLNFRFVIKKGHRFQRQKWQYGNPDDLVVAGIGNLVPVGNGVDFGLSDVADATVFRFPRGSIFNQSLTNKRVGQVQHLATCAIGQLAHEATRLDQGILIGFFLDFATRTQQAVDLDILFVGKIDKEVGIVPALLWSLLP